MAADADEATDDLIEIVDPSSVPKTEVARYADHFARRSLPAFGWIPKALHARAFDEKRVAGTNSSTWITKVLYLLQPRELLDEDTLQWKSYQVLLGSHVRHSHLHGFELMSTPSES